MEADSHSNVIIYFFPPKTSIFELTNRELFYLNLRLLHLQSKDSSIKIEVQEFPLAIPVSTI